MATDRVDIVETNGISASQLSELLSLGSNIRSHVNGRTLQRYLERRNPFEINNVGYSLAPRLDTSAMLHATGVQIIPARTKPIVLTDFFKTRPGLCTTSTYDGGFTLEKFGSLEAVNAVGPLSERLYITFKVKQIALEKSLLEDLPEDYLATLDDIAGLIDLQMRGESGVLFQNNCRRNCFFVAVDSKILVVGITKHREDLYVTAESSGGVYDVDCQILCPVSARFMFSLLSNAIQR